MAFWHQHATQVIFKESPGDCEYVFPNPVFFEDIRFDDGGTTPLRLSHASRFHHSVAVIWTGYGDMLSRRQENSLAEFRRRRFSQAPPSTGKTAWWFQALGYGDIAHLLRPCADFSI